MKVSKGVMNENRRRRLKVLVIVEGLLPPTTVFSGLKGVYQLQRRLAQEDLELHILTTTYPWVDSKWKEWIEKEACQNLQFHVIDTKFLGDVHLLAHYAFSKPKMFFKACQLCRTEKFDIVHEYSSSPLLINLTALYHILFGVRAFHTICTYDRRTPVLSKWRMASKFMDGVVLASRELKERFTTAGWDKTIYLPVGMELTPFQKVPGPDQTRYEEELRVRMNLEREKIVLFLGPLEERKGIHTLAEAAKIVLEVNNNVVFVVATYDKEGKDRQYPKSMLRLQKAIFGKEAWFRIIEGKHDVSLLMSAADIFVLPAKEAHGTLAQPLTLLEAMAAGKAIVASNIEGARELILDGENGLLFEKGDSEKLSRAIITLLNDENLIERLGGRARADIADLDVDNVASRLLDIYKR